MTRPQSTFTFERREEAACQDTTLWCLANWPPPIRGTVYRYLSDEQPEASDSRTSGHKRIFYAYVPKRATGKVPVWIMLHGGGGNALETLAKTPLVRMADRRGTDPGVDWQRNTETCSYRPGDGFVDGAGAKCQPDKVYFNNAEPFVVVYPEGIVDAAAPDKRHWEDGRDPSPGHDVSAEQRDDVGFINHVIEVMRAQQPELIDPSRIYLAGMSNGGMMTQRVLCNLTHPRYPELKRIAAAVSQIAAMPEPLGDGLAGRERCPAKGTHQLGIASFVGKGIPTPDCTPFPCKSPMVSGDGLMPHGEPGGRHHVWSPDAGRVMSVPDTHNFWRDYLVSATGVQKPTGTREVRGFSELVTVLYGDQPARLMLVVTDGGSHLTASSRGDINVQARAWRFLSSFARSAEGKLVFRDSTAVTGEL